MGESSGGARRNERLQLCFTSHWLRRMWTSINCRKARGFYWNRLPRGTVTHLYRSPHCRECLPAAPWLLGRPSRGDCAAWPTAQGSPPVGYAGLFHTAGTSAIFYYGSGLTWGNLCRPVWVQLICHSDSTSGDTPQASVSLGSNLILGTWTGKFYNKWRLALLFHCNRDSQHLDAVKVNSRGGGGRAWLPRFIYIFLIMKTKQIPNEQ